MTVKVTSLDDLIRMKRAAARRRITRRWRSSEPCGTRSTASARDAPVGEGRVGDGHDPHGARGHRRDGGGHRPAPRAPLLRPAPPGGPGAGAGQPRGRGGERGAPPGGGPRRGGGAAGGADAAGDRARSAPAAPPLRAQLRGGGGLHRAVQGAPPPPPGLHPLHRRPGGVDGLRDQHRHPPCGRGQPVWREPPLGRGPGAGERRLERDPCAGRGDQAGGERRRAAGGGGQGPPRRADRGAARRGPP